MDRATNLVKRLELNPQSSDSDKIANELLAAYHRGSPVGSLRRLLVSDNDRLVGEAAWIASELGGIGKPLLGDVARLLGHRSKKARFWSIDCVQMWADLSNGLEIASTIRLADDPEPSVRWKAMCFLGLAAREQLETAMAWFRATDPHAPYFAELMWLLGREGADPDAIIAGIRGLTLR